MYLVVGQDHDCVEEKVDQVEAEWLELVQQVVQAEGENRHRSVGLVTLLLHHRSSPEIILQQSPDRDMGPQVPAVQPSTALGVPQQHKETTELHRRLFNKEKLLEKLKKFCIVMLNPPRAL